MKYLLLLLLSVNAHAFDAKEARILVLKSRSKEERSVRPIINKIEASIKVEASKGQPAIAVILSGEDCPKSDFVLSVLKKHGFDAWTSVNNRCEMIIEWIK